MCMNVNFIHVNFSQYTIHTTQFRRGSNGYPICVKIPDGQIVNYIENVGNKKFKVHSPGASNPLSPTK